MGRSSITSVMPSPMLKRNITREIVGNMNSHPQGIRADEKIMLKTVGVEA